MGLFTGKNKETEPLVPPVSQEFEGAGGHSRAYIEALSRAVGTARVRQLALGESLRDAGNWNIDFHTGRMAFADREYPIQFLGSESESSGTWLWGVDNINGFPDEVLADVRRFFSGDGMRELPDLQERELVLDEYVNGHNIASLVAATHRDRVCYYRCAYDGGAAFVLLGGIEQSVFAPPEPVVVIRVLQDLIGGMSLDHRLLVQGTFAGCCARVEELEGGIIGICSAGRAVTVEFDPLGRIARMSASDR